MPKTDILGPICFSPHDPILLHHLIIDIKEHIGCIILAKIYLKSLRGNMK